MWRSARPISKTGSRWPKRAGRRAELAWRFRLHTERVRRVRVADSRTRRVRAPVSARCLKRNLLSHVGGSDVAPTCLWRTAAGGAATALAVRSRFDVHVYVCQRPTAYPARDSIHELTEGFGGRIPARLGAGSPHDRGPPTQVALWPIRHQRRKRSAKFSGARWSTARVARACGRSFAKSKTPSRLVTPMRRKRLLLRPNLK